MINDGQTVTKTARDGRAPAASTTRRLNWENTMSKKNSNKKNVKKVAVDAIVEEVAPIETVKEVAVDAIVETAAATAKPSGRAKNAYGYVVGTIADVITTSIMSGDDTAKTMAVVTEKFPTSRASSEVAKLHVAWYRSKLRKFGFLAKRGAAANVSPAQF